MNNHTTAFLELRDVKKHYGGVRALDGVSFQCSRGSIHAVLGENGAGKSTLIKIISGVVQPTAGEILMDGKLRKYERPIDATRDGVTCIFQELSLMPDLNVADNISIASPPKRFGMIDQRAQRAKAEELLACIGCEGVNPLSRVSDLSLSERQMVEIAKALGQNPKVLILDEATSALTARDVQTVYDLLEKLRKDGLAILYISHRMHEIDYLADRLSVFRNGQHISSFDKGDHSNKEIVEMMIGRDVTAQFPPKPKPTKKSTHLKIDDLRWANKINGVSLEVGKGEIIGLGGLDGQGQKELLLSLFGVLKDINGTISIDGKAVKLRSPTDAKSAENAIALVPEDRKTEGLMLPMSIADNLIAASYDKLRSGALIDREKTDRAIEDSVERLQIKVDTLDRPVSTMSGGNQQKVVIAKWLLIEPGLVLLNDPTRGIDVGTKQEIYLLLRKLAEQGTAIILYSTDYDELIGVCDRVMVMYDGSIVSELEGDDITEQNIIASSLNIDAGEEVSA